MEEDRLVEIGKQHHQAGRLMEAQDYYERCLELNDRNHAALHLLGVIAYQRGNFEFSLQKISSAISINRSIPVYHCNLGNAFFATGQVANAEVAYRDALLLDQSYSDAHFNLGNVFAASGRYEEARTSYSHALRNNPNNVMAHFNLANVTSLTALIHEGAKGGPFLHFLESRQA